MIQHAYAWHYIHFLVIIYRTLASPILECVWIQMLRMYEVQSDEKQDAIGPSCVSLIVSHCMLR